MPFQKRDANSGDWRECPEETVNERAKRAFPQNPKSVIQAMIANPGASFYFARYSVFRYVEVTPPSGWVPAFARRNG